MTSKKEILVFSTPAELARKLSDELVRLSSIARPDRPFTIALAGGSTPGLLYSCLADNYKDLINWAELAFFWGDERCVSPDSPESNFGMANKALLSKVNCRKSNIHRIAGENDPWMEAARYEEEIVKYTLQSAGVPRFDLVLLGLGEDGHTASLFPDQSDVINSKRICEVAVHPESHQKRITLTLPVLNNASVVLFLVIGEKKNSITRKILESETGSESFPASLVVPQNGKLVWMLDREAASGLMHNTGNYHFF
jgi:6-phosphogluconolactonase